MKKPISDMLVRSIQYLRSPAFITVFMNLLIAVMFIFIGAALSAVTPLNKYIAAAVIAVLYIITALLSNALCSVISNRFGGSHEAHNGPLFGNMTLDFIGRLNMPAIVCDNNSKVVWYNKLLGELIPLKSLHGVTFDKVCPLDLEELLGDTNPNGRECMIFDGCYRVKAYRLASQNKSYYVAVFTDNTELY